MANSGGTKLIKIASAINIGKETIVAFLKERGYDIENKVTASLTDDMVDAVYGHFQKELTQAERSRQRAEERKKHDTPEKQVEQPISVGGAEIPVAAPTQSSVEVVSAPAESQVSASEESSNEPTSLVGTVISLDGLTSGRKQAKRKEDVKPSAIVTEEAFITQPTVESVPPPVEQLSTPTVEAPPTQEVTAKAAEETTSQEKEHTTPSVTSVETEESKPTQVEEVKKSASIAPAEESEEHAARKRKKRMMGELEYKADEATTPAAPQGLTILGKIDLNVRNRRAGNTGSGTSGSGGGYTSGNRQDQRSDGRRDFQRDGGNQRDSNQRDGGQRSGGGSQRDGGQRSGGNQRDGVQRSGGYQRDQRSDNRPSDNRFARPDNRVQRDVRPQDQRLPRVDADIRFDDDDDNGSREPIARFESKPIVRTSAPDGPKPQRVFGNMISARDDERGAKKKRKKGAVRREEVNQEEVERAIRRTLAGGEDSMLVARNKLRQKRKIERAEEQARQAELDEAKSSILRVTEFITAAELANLMRVQVNDIILKSMQLGLMVSINQRLDKDSISLIADDYGYTIEFEEDFSIDEQEDEEDDEETLVSRAPIVTIMGHVDHGKTSLLDYIRKSNVVAGEAGGITQHIGAYTVPMKGTFITFLDTPGHQAFTAMRARGAQITDIVVLVVAADDSVMPQTIEAISHANAANVPIVVAINKIDKPEANPDRIRQQLADHGVLVEEWGGKNQSALISAKKGLNIEQLLEKILLEAELLTLRANPNRRAFGTVIESKLDKGKGAVATVIVQKGTLRVGDPFICGTSAGRVRAMFDHLGQRVDQADPSMPVQLLGFDGVPQAGDQLLVMESESKVKELATKRQQIKREQDFNQVRHLTLDDISAQIKVGGVQTLKIIVKGDADGSVEALTNELQKLATAEVGVQVIHKAVGPISEADVMLASASSAIIVGFHVRPFPQAKKLAEVESVDIRTYRIIYDCVNEIKLALEGMLAPEVKEEIVGTAEIRVVFKISKVGNIAGCMVQDGRINRNDTVRIIRDGFEIFTGKLSTLKRVKDDAREVNAGFECGMSFDGYNDIKIGDIVEAVQTVEVKRKLA